jgi:hypothetical protein
MKDNFCQNSAIEYRSSEPCDPGFVSQNFVTIDGVFQNSAKKDPILSARFDTGQFVRTMRHRTCLSKFCDNGCCSLEFCDTTPVCHIDYE